MEKHHSNKIRHFIFYFLLISALLIISIWYFSTKEITVKTATLSKGNYQQILNAEGKARAKAIYLVSMPEAGEINRINLKSGDWVKKNEMVAEFKSGKKISAPIDGRVLKVFEENAGTFPAGKPLLQIANTDQLEVVASVLSEDAVDIPEKAKVIMTNWGGKNPLEGEVKKIEPSAFTEVSALGVKEQRVNVMINLVSPRNLYKNLGEGYSLDVAILLYSLKNVLTIPVSALFREGENWATYVVKNNRAEKRIVYLKTRNDEVAVVEKGVEAGDKVIIYPSDQIYSGARVNIN